MNDPKPPDQPSSVATDVDAPTEPPKAPNDSPPSDPQSDPQSDPRTDPQSGVDTKEHSLADLREAARLAHLHAPLPTVAPVAPDGGERIEVDLVEAERQEVADLEAASTTTAPPETAPSEVGSIKPAPAETGELAADDSDPIEPEAVAGSPIDPRIRERRVAVTRAEGRRRLRILLTVVVVASAIGIAWLIVQSPFLAVKTINVKGASRESAADVEQAAGVKDGAALLFVNTGDVARRVEELPWVAEASVKRELPTSLTITVLERSPVAWVRRPVPAGSPEGTLGAIVLVDRSGRVLGDEAQPPVGLPELIGMSRVPDRGDRIEPSAPARAIAQLPDALRAQTATLHRRGGQAVLELVKELPGGAQPAAGEVKLGNLEAIGAKGAAALAVLDQLFAGREDVGYIDVRVPGAPATGD